MAQIKLIAFDADDTLWHNETFYQDSINRLVQLLAPYASEEQVRKHLDEVEAKNIGFFGYGIKSFVLSMVENAVDLSNEKIQGDRIRQIIELGKGMLAAEMTPLPGVEQTLNSLSRAYPLMLITKGDLMDQEAKLERSGLSSYFNYIEIVSDKNPKVYQRVLDRYRLQPAEFLMVGNSLKSDIYPVIQVGGWAVYVPYENTWAHELAVEGEIQSERMVEIEKIDRLPGVIKQLTAADGDKPD